MPAHFPADIHVATTVDALRASMEEQRPGDDAVTWEGDRDAGQAVPDGPLVT